MVRETGVQSQVDLYQILKKWYLMPPFLTLSIIRYGSRVKWSNPGKGVAPFPTPRCISYWKGSLRVTLDSCGQLYFTVCKFMCVCVCVYIHVYTLVHIYFQVSRFCFFLSLSPLLECKIVSVLVHACVCAYIYIYIYGHPQTDLFRSMRTHQCG